MARSSDAVVDGSTVYVKDSNTVEIYSYDVTTDSWSELPNCTEALASITVINGWLTTVGGAGSNELFSLTGKGTERRWSKKFPLMPTKRSYPAALCTGNILIVVGGKDGYVVLSTVEVMNTENHQWSTAAELPQPKYSASATVYGGSIYMLGGYGLHHVSVTSVYSCSLSDLLRSCDAYSLEAKLERTALEDKTSIWKRVADLPVAGSVCVCFHGRLLAVGGKDDSREPASAVHMYNPTTNFWIIISHVTTGRYRPFAAVLPDNRLMVVGGIESTPWSFSHFSDSVIFASL